MSRREPPTLPELVRDTPVKPMKPLDDRLARYNADLPSVPPPPQIDEQRAAFVEQRKVSRSGSWDLEKILGGQQVYYERALERAIAEERHAHLAERAAKAEAELELRDKRKRDLIDSTVKAVLAFLAIGLIGLVGKLLLLGK